MMRKYLFSFAIASLVTASTASASVDLIAIGSVSGTYEDLASKTASALENGVPGNTLGGVGSGLAYAGGNTFLALPDRGPNAVAYNATVDDTTSYIPRFQTFNLSLAPSPAGSPFPFILTPFLTNTTLLSSRTPLTYANTGVPALNTRNNNYFTGRSDNFDPTQNSLNPKNARFDPEGIRVSRDGQSVFISDEYGPYVYEFDRATGRRLQAFQLPNNLAVTNLSAVGNTEISGNTSGRVANKGMEGLAITPDGKTLVGVMQAALLQDSKTSIRIVTININTGTTREYAYQLTTGSGVSEILAINDHEFLLDERDGKGRGDGSSATVKQLFKIDLDGATDVTTKKGDLSAWAVKKTLFLDIVKVLNANGIASTDIPAKIEGIAFGPDVTINTITKHTLFVANDNDFLANVGGLDNPNQFFVFTFDNNDLPTFVPQRIGSFSVCEGEDD